MEFLFVHLLVVVLVAAVSSGLAALLFYAIARQRYEYTCAVMMSDGRCCLTPTRAFIPDAPDTIAGVDAHVQVCQHHADLLNGRTFKTLATHVFDTH